MRPRTRYVPSLDTLPTRLAPSTIPVYSAPVSVPTTPPSTVNICTDSVATTTVDPTLMAPPTSVGS